QVKSCFARVCVVCVRVVPTTRRVDRPVLGWNSRVEREEPPKEFWRKSNNSSFLQHDPRSDDDGTGISRGDGDRPAHWGGRPPPARGVGFADKSCFVASRPPR
ncbi:unnamed protein product, partial [Ectocarpus sp. 8 AP-2014]